MQTELTLRYMHTRIQSTPAKPAEKTVANPGNNVIMAECQGHMGIMKASISLLQKQDTIECLPTLPISLLPQRSSCLARE